MTSNVLMNVNIDPSSFQAKKAVKRKGDAVIEGAMDIDSYNGIEGCTSQQSTNSKRRKPSSEGTRKIPVPANRYTPLKENWLKIFTPIVEHLHLQVRFNLKTRNVEIRLSNETTDTANLQKAADFVKVSHVVRYHIP